MPIHQTPAAWSVLWSPALVCHLQFHSPKLRLFAYLWQYSQENAVLDVSSMSSGSLKPGIDILLGTSNCSVRSGNVQVLLEPQAWHSAPAWWASTPWKCGWLTSTLFLTSWETMSISWKAGLIPRQIAHLLQGFLEGIWSRIVEDTLNQMAESCLEESISTL